MNKIAGYVAAVFSVVLILWCLKPVPKTGKDGIDYARFGTIPIQSNGRVKPLSTEALSSLRTLSGKSSVKKVVDGKEVKDSAIVWYARILFDEQAASKDKVFRVDNPEVKDHINLDPDGKMYAFEDLKPNLERIQKAAEPAREKHAKKRSPFETEMVNLFQKVVLYTALSRSMEIQNDLGFAECATGAQRLVPALEGLDPDPAKWSATDRQTAEMTRRLFGVIGQMATSCPIRLVPPAKVERNGEGMDAKAWRNPYAALFMGIRDEDPEQDLEFATALSEMQLAWRKLNPKAPEAEADEEEAAEADGEAEEADPYGAAKSTPAPPELSDEEREEHAAAFNRAVEDWHKAIDASKAEPTLAAVPTWRGWVLPFYQISMGCIILSLWVACLMGAKHLFKWSIGLVVITLLGGPAFDLLNTLIVSDGAPLMGYVGFENWYNTFEPFYKSIVLYVAAFILVCIGFLGDGKTILRWAVILTVAGLAFHTLGLADRILIGGRPPVTTLHSSALFIGWVCVILGLVLERFFRGGVGVIVATSIAAITLMKGFQLAADGSDTMGALVAVLDSNFWLATHVICISIGYASCYVAALVAHVYLFRGICTESLTRKEAKKLDTMNYGIICFGLFFSVVGTILGGIWADQSWGRFWGWDPKENGAMMICLWLIIGLHARLGGYVKVHGLMLMSVGASIITTISWFGVNLMGTGLHSYGFTREGLYTFLGFILFQFGVLLIGAIPRRIWRSAAVLLPKKANPQPADGPSE